MCATKLRHSPQPSVAGGPRSIVPLTELRETIENSETCGTCARAGSETGRAGAARHAAAGPGCGPAPGYCADMDHPRRQTPHGESAYSPVSLLRALTANPLDVDALRGTDGAHEEASPPDTPVTRTLTVILAVVLGFVVA